MYYIQPLPSCSDDRWSYCWSYCRVTLCSGSVFHLHCLLLLFVNKSLCKFESSLRVRNREVILLVQGHRKGHRKGFNIFSRAYDPFASLGAMSMIALWRDNLISAD